MFGILGMYGIMPFACSSSAVQTFRDVQVSHSARWATHDVIGETPVNEYIGPDRQKISFKVQILSAMNGSPALTVMALDRMLKSGKSWPLCLGPEYFGRFILAGFNEERRHFSGTGSPVSMEVNLSLEEDRAFSLMGAITSLLGG